MVTNVKALPTETPSPVSHPVDPLYRRKWKMITSYFKERSLWNMCSNLKLISDYYHSLSTNQFLSGLLQAVGPSHTHTHTNYQHLSIQILSPTRFETFSNTHFHAPSPFSSYTRAYIISDLFSNNLWNLWYNILKQYKHLSPFFICVENEVLIF